tara:strand:- start:38 stop:481 length:444 start_codon:yes stop_codon:yes gene_type:complete
MSERRFTIENAYHSDGCETKFKNKGYSGVYVSSNPSSAARKAFSQLCRVKRIHGRCTLIIAIRETTQGSSKKVFLYKLTRMKLKNPIELQGRVINYETKCKSVSSVSKCAVGSRKTSGKRRSLRNVNRNRSRLRSRSRSRSKSRKRR